MGVTNTNNVLSTGCIPCDGSLQVTLSITAAPDILSHPTDIVLVLDRSGSMAGDPLANLKLGARTFLDILAEATGGAADGQIGSGSSIGVVSFANQARTDAPLMTDADGLKAAVDGLEAGGSTNHADAFRLAARLLDTGSGNAKVIVLFTDGNTTAGPSPLPAAQAARDQGITVYSIGLLGSDGLDVQALNDWATSPAAAHVAVTPDAADLTELFARLAGNLSKPGATEIVLEDTIHPDFRITSLARPDRGTAVILNDTALRWRIPQLGVTGSESAQLHFVVRHVGLTGGEKEVNSSLSYHDREGNAVRFPHPTVAVDCGVVTCPEDCPQPVDFTVDGCQDTLCIHLGETALTCQGHILQLDVTLKDVCPDTRVALGVILTETDETGTERRRGMKTMALPAHHAPGRRDMAVRGVTFVVPDLLQEEDGSPARPCTPRKFSARLIAHPMDSGHRCCRDADRAE